MLPAVFIAVTTSFVVSLLVTMMVRAWAAHVGFVDEPGGHKRHGTPVALGGGLALVVAVCGSILAVTLLVRQVMGGAGQPDWFPRLLRVHGSGIASKLPTVLGIVAGAVILHIVGWIDDRRGLSPWPKLAVQFAVAFFIAGPMGIRVVEVLPVPWSVGVTMLWIVLITNAFNFLDNMDGLSAGVAMIAAAIFAVASTAAGQVFVPLMAWVVVGACGGFLLFNFSPATIYMGDCGSLVLGYFLSVLTILTTFYDEKHGLTPFGVLVPIVVLSVPLYDVFSVVFHRLCLGKNPLRGDRRHFSHRLVRRGMTPRAAVLTIYLATAATGLGAIILARVDWPGAILLLVQCFCVVAMIAILEHTGTNSTKGDSHGADVS